MVRDSASGLCATAFLWKDLPMHVSAWPAVWSLYCTWNGRNISHHSRCMAPTSPKAATQLDFFDVLFFIMHAPTPSCPAPSFVNSVTLLLCLWAMMMYFSCLPHLCLFYSSDIFTFCCNWVSIFCTSPGEQLRQLGALCDWFCCEFCMFRFSFFFPLYVCIFIFYFLFFIIIMYRHWILMMKPIAHLWYEETHDSICT